MVLKKEKELAILDCASKYKKILTETIMTGKNYQQENMLFDSTISYYEFWKHSTLDVISEDERFIYKINFILASMTKKVSEIIFNEFFFTENKYVWMSKYNRSTYYRLRAKAIDEFYEAIK